MWVWPGAGLCIATVLSLDAVATIPRLWVTHVSEVWDERDGEKDWRGEFRRHCACATFTIGSDY